MNGENSSIIYERMNKRIDSMNQREKLNQRLEMIESVFKLDVSADWEALSLIYSLAKRNMIEIWDELDDGEVEKIAKRLQIIDLNVTGHLSKFREDCESEEAITFMEMLGEDLWACGVDLPTTGTSYPILKKGKKSTLWDKSLKSLNEKQNQEWILFNLLSSDVQYEPLKNIVNWTYIKPQEMAKAISRKCGFEKALGFLLFMGTQSSDMEGSEIGLLMEDLSGMADSQNPNDRARRIIEKVQEGLSINDKEQIKMLVGKAIILNQIEIAETVIAKYPEMGLFGSLKDVVSGLKSCSSLKNLSTLAKDLAESKIPWITRGEEKNHGALFKSLFEKISLDFGRSSERRNFGNHVKMIMQGKADELNEKSEIIEEIARWAGTIKMGDGEKLDIEESFEILADLSALYAIKHCSLGGLRGAVMGLLPAGLDAQTFVKVKNNKERNLNPELVGVLEEAIMQREAMKGMEKQRVRL